MMTRGGYRAQKMGYTATYSETGYILQNGDIYQIQFFVSLLDIFVIKRSKNGR